LLIKETVVGLAIIHGVIDWGFQKKDFLWQKLEGNAFLFLFSGSDLTFAIRKSFLD
jgi:hypothetical protein